MASHFFQNKVAPPNHDSLGLLGVMSTWPPASTSTLSVLATPFPKPPRLSLTSGPSSLPCVPLLFLEHTATS